MGGTIGDLEAEPADYGALDDTDVVDATGIDQLAQSDEQWRVGLGHSLNDQFSTFIEMLQVCEQKIEFVGIDDYLTLLVDRYPAAPVLVE